MQKLLLTTLLKIGLASILLSLSTFGNAQVGTSYQLNSDMEEFSDVVRYVISPNSQRVVYMADHTVNDVIELYSVSTEGGEPVRLNPPLIVGRNVVQAEISADSQWVVYRANQDSAGVNELYVVSIEGGVPLKISGPTGGRVFSGFAISNDSQRVVFRKEHGGKIKLFSALISGGAAIELAGSTATMGDVQDFVISNDAEHVVFKADQSGITKLFRVAVSGGPPEALTDSLGSVSSIQEFVMSSDSENVVFRASQSGIDKLYSAPIMAGTVQELNGTLGSSNDVLSFQVSRDAERVVYVADQDTDNVFEFFSVSIDGGTPVKLSEPPSSTNITDEHEYQISADSEHVVYIASKRSSGGPGGPGGPGGAQDKELYSVPIQGGVRPTKLNAELVSGGDVLSFEISENGKQVVYLADQDQKGTRELYSVSVSGGVDPIKLNPELPSGRDIGFKYKISGDTERVSYLADQDTDGTAELYSVSIGGGPVTKLSGDLPASADVDNFAVSQNSEFIVYRADQNVFDQQELFAHRLKNKVTNDEICMPIKTASSSVAVICL